VWTLRTKKVVIRDQFRVLPMPDIVIAHLDQLATADGYSRGSDPSLEKFLPPDNEDEIEDDIADAIQELTALTDMMPIDGRADG